MSNFLDIALQHAALGLYVFPVARDKSTRTHHGYKDATVDPEKIREWWDAMPSANPGFYPGGSDDAVLDIDHGLTDLESFIAWRDRNGIPATYTVRSGSRPEFKVHMYFKGAMRDVGLWS
jgi:bifunctional DNA primase/polymerase-like protein